MTLLEQVLSQEPVFATRADAEELLERLKKKAAE
jgi:uncharacterized protein YfcZ (UPF0381/DUF406 family)